MRTEIIKKNGKSIYYMDFTFIRDVKEIEGIIKEASTYIRNQPESSLLTLTNVQGMHFNNAIREAFISFVSGNKPYVKSGAVIGMSGLIKIVYNGMLKVTGRNLRAFNEKEEAMDYLMNN